MLFVNYEDYYDETKGNDMNLTIDATIQYYLRCCLWVPRDSF